MTLDDSYREMCLEVEALRASLERKVRHCDEITEERDKALRERDEARAERDNLLDGDGPCHACREYAYRRGAEAMRLACQQWCRAWENDGNAIADALADLRVEEP